MGAEVFIDEGSGETAQDAFATLTRQARYNYGHAGYTGTIGEKHGYTMIPLPEGEDAQTYAGELIDGSDSRVDDKWGPAGCIDLGDGKFLFFGWASC